VEICCTWMLSSKGSYYDKVGPIEGCYTKGIGMTKTSGKHVIGWCTLAENYWMIHTVLCLVCCFVHIRCLITLYTGRWGTKTYVVTITQFKENVAYVSKILKLFLCIAKWLVTRSVGRFRKVNIKIHMRGVSLWMQWWISVVYASSLLNTQVFTGKLFSLFYSCYLFCAVDNWGWALLYMLCSTETCTLAKWRESRVIRAHCAFVKGDSACLMKLLELGSVITSG